MIDRKTIFDLAVSEIRRHAAAVLVAAQAEGEHVAVLVAQEMECIADTAAMNFDSDTKAGAFVDPAEEDAGRAGHEAEEYPRTPAGLAMLEHWEGGGARSIAAVYANVFGVAPAVGLDTDAQFAELVDRVGDEDAWILVTRELADQELRRAIDGKPGAGV